MPRRLSFATLSIAVSACLTPATAAFASEDAVCILAGRVGEGGRWAPRLPGLSLLDARGSAVQGASVDALAKVRQVRVATATTLTRCEGRGATIATGPDAPGERLPVPILTAGPAPITVVAVHDLRSRLGEWVELQVTPPPERRSTAPR